MHRKPYAFEHAWYGDDDDADQKDVAVVPGRIQQKSLNDTRTQDEEEKKNILVDGKQRKWAGAMCIAVE